ncbi:glutamate formimidoyltransferase [Aggregatilinea lenta]|uniref:glutamate formimidoyltransferase n=1 Tax=Aggregatilinea lenta TaxID=913108 RepID=UPI0013C2E97A|nr:glutamate formimidoyltransferase [Aggregatilinea lenta]
MSHPLVECIPNFSEGRRPEVVEAIVTAIRQAAPVHVLDTSSDPDHNRTVVTFVGTPEAVERAAFAGIKAAAEHIDLTQHSGEHPRLGAADVVPFVPIRGVTMAECTGIAQRLGQAVGEQLDIPVYLYEAAATRPDRENLADLRSSKFQYEQLREVIGTDPDRLPDFGPASVGTAGATVIGARPPLVAFNVYLDTNKVEIAANIARAVRHSSGGLRFVKAAGFLVEGQAQVSMNLTHYQKTPVYRVVEMIRREAARYGVSVTFSELVGLAPQEFFVEAARWYLQLDKFEPDQILEYRIQSAEAAPEPLAEAEPPVPEEATRHVETVEVPALLPLPFLNAVASDAPAPGGGAVAALSGALSAALAEMVAGLTVGKKQYADVEPAMRAIVAAGGDLRQKLTAAIEDDILAFSAVMEGYRLPKDDPERPAVIERGMIRAADVPLTVARLSLEAMQLAEQVALQGNRNAASDAASAGLIGLAAVESAALNVRVNAASLADEDMAARYRNDIGAIVSQARAVRDRVVQAAEARAGL